MENEHYDLAVIGGGSGGFAAALLAGRHGVRTIVVERYPILGGTATVGGVHCWEIGIGGTGIPFDLYKRIKAADPNAISIYSFGRHFGWQEQWNWPHAMEKVNFPGGELLIDATRGYHDTLRRYTGEQTETEEFSRETWHGVPFLPEAMSEMMVTMLEETGYVTVRTNCACTGVEAQGGKVLRATLSDGSVISADAWVDGSGGIFSHACGCQTLRGMDTRALFAEPGAPEEASDIVNGVSLIYTITPIATPEIAPLPADIPEECWWAANFPPICCNQYPNGDRNCNMLPTMEGRERIQLGYQAAYAECVRRVKAHWHFIQSNFPEFQYYRLAWIAPMLGIRESRRVVCKYMLTANDIIQGIRKQIAPDIIAISDHALDRHGAGGGAHLVREPYGIPFRCLVPKGWTNLLVACRAAGFSSIAATSCRLTRTMMQLGQAAGNAVALSRELGVALPEVPIALLRQRLHQQHVQLSWPADEALQEYLLEE